MDVSDAGPGLPALVGGLSDLLGGDGDVRFRERGIRLPVMAAVMMIFSMGGDVACFRFKAV